MDSTTAKYARGLISDRYVDVGMENIQSTRKLVAKLLSNRKIPETGWSESAIETFLTDIARMDSNNFEGNTGVGEREGRVVCPIVSRRNYQLAHGIGRSGDIAAEQPKAAGSSILAKLVRYLALDAIRMCGVKLAKSALVLPMATGMSLALVFSTLRNMRGSKAKYVVWSRCDQKSCFKAILSAGLVRVNNAIRIFSFNISSSLSLSLSLFLSISPHAHSTHAHTHTTYERRYLLWSKPN